MNTSLPIKEIQVINKIKELYLKKGLIGDYLMFLLAINTGINIKNPHCRQKMWNRRDLRIFHSRILITMRWKNVRSARNEEL